MGRIYDALKKAQEKKDLGIGARRSSPESRSLVLHDKVIDIVLNNVQSKEGY